MVFSGSGGQGVITAGIILAEAAVLHENLIAVQSQTYGPRARGGATRSDVIISDSDIHYPKVIQPNVLVCLTQEAYDTFCPIIRPGGLLVIDAGFVEPKKKRGRPAKSTSDVPVSDARDRKADRVQYLYARGSVGSDRSGQTEIGYEGPGNPNTRNLSGNKSKGTSLGVEAGGR